MNKIELKTGTLKLKLNEELKELIEFGSRQNKKRGFLFVSRVLGKHIPVKPSTMEETHIKLANKLKSKLSGEPTIVIGFAETATALGHGVYEKLGLKDSFYIHSTRFQTSKEVLLGFYEAHCHAPSHIFYKPIDEIELNILQNAKNIVLVDDEVSTGNTVKSLVGELKKVLPNAKNYYLVSILNWMKQDFEEITPIYLYKDNFEFEPKEYEIDDSIKSITKNSVDLDEIIPHNFGRYGVREINIDFSKFVNIDKLKDKKILILGTAEFMYIPYLFAKYLENSNIETYYQATTRSPINIDKGIKSSIRFIDNYFEEIDNFLYNVIDKSYDKVFICYESTKLPQNHNLAGLLISYNFEVERLYFKA